MHGGSRVSMVFLSPIRKQRCGRWNEVWIKNFAYHGFASKILMKSLKVTRNLGGAPRKESEMRAFQDMVDECKFMDLGFIGHKFTWWGKRLRGLVLERIDRAFANTSWLDQNPATWVQHFRAHSSNHNPNLIKPDGIPACRNKPFRFEQMWLKEEGCGDTVKVAWGSTVDINPMPLVSQKIKKCRERLIEWSKHSFGSVWQQLEEKTRDLIKAKWAAAKGFDTTNVRSLQV